MKRLFLLTLLVFLTACSYQVKDSLLSLGYSEEEVAKIRELDEAVQSYFESSYNKELLDVIKVTDAESLFNIGLPFNIGVYHLTKDGGWINTFNNNLLSKMIEKVISTDNVKNHTVVDDLDGISLLISKFTGGQGGRLEFETPFMMTKKKSYFTNKINEFTNETYLEQRTRTAWGNVKPKATNTNIKFATREERDNFYDSWNTKPLRWMFNTMKNDIHANIQALPWLGDYTHPWTDEDLYKYFELTDDEIKIIEDEIK